MELKLRKGEGSELYMNHIYNISIIKHNPLYNLIKIQLSRIG